MCNTSKIDDTIIKTTQENLITLMHTYWIFIALSFILRSDGDGFTTCHVCSILLWLNYS
jgi:hypothetical protein